MPTESSKFSALRSGVVAQHREAVDECWFLLSGFPSWWERLFRTDRSRPGRAVRHGEANPGRRGPFWDHSSVVVRALVD